MAEELQGLLDRIQTEGLDKAKAEAKAILEDARKQAAEIVEKAEATASQKIAVAEDEAEKFKTRSVNAVEQAARDVVLSVGDAVQYTFDELAGKEIQQALNHEDFAQIVKDVILSYAKQDGNETIEVLLSTKQSESVEAYLQKSLQGQLREGITVRSNRGIISGFSVVLRDKGVEHDFSGETLTATFTELLRPQLAEIVKNAMGKIQKKP